MEENKKVIDDYTNVVNKLIVDEIKKNNKKIVPRIVERMILDDKDLFKDLAKHIAKSIIEESPYIRYGQAVFNYVDEKYGVANIVQFKYRLASISQFYYEFDCFYDDTKVEQFLDKCYELIKTVNRND